LTFLKAIWHFFTSGLAFFVNFDLATLVFITAGCCHGTMSSLLHILWKLQ